jgi:hypothetical protein
MIAKIATAVQTTGYGKTLTKQSSVTIETILSNAPRGFRK